MDTNRIQDNVDRKHNLLVRAYSTKVRPTQSATACHWTAAVYAMRLRFRKPQAL